MSVFERDLEIKMLIDRLSKQTNVQRNTIEVLTTSNTTLQNSISHLRDNIDNLLGNNRDSFIKTVTLEGNSGLNPFLKLTINTESNNSSIMSVKAVATTFNSEDPKTFVFIRTVQFSFNKHTGLLTDANISSHQPNPEFRAALNSLDTTWTLSFNTNNLQDVKITVLISFLSDEQMTFSLE
jgi:hypothetical protein